LEKHIPRFWNIASPLTRLAYCQSSKCPPLARMQARRRALSQLRCQLHSVKGRAKCPAVPQFRGLVNDTLSAGQGGK